MLDIVSKALQEVAENPNAAPGRLTQIETTMRPGDRATWDGTLVWEPTLNVGKYAGESMGRCSMWCVNTMQVTVAVVQDVPE